jgi:AraC-like DNA-binding protein
MLMHKEEQIVLINDIQANLKLILLEPEGLLPSGYLSMFRIILTLIFTVAQLVLVIQWKNKLSINRIHSPHNNELIQWLQLFSMLLMTSLSLLSVQTFLQVSSKFHFEEIIIITMGLTNLIASALLFARPKILYGMVGWMQEKQPIISLKDSSTNLENAFNTPERQTLSIAEGRSYALKLEEYFKTNNQYLEPGYTINDLARQLKIPVYQLSSFINQEYQKSFVQFINDQRFEYFLDMKKKDPDFKNYTIDYLGKKIGFNSRTSFVSFIKKRTGKTPSEFLKEA